VVVTGIVVRAETLTTGRGCGPKPGQVFKYAVVVYGKNPGNDAFELPLAANVYDCFADGTFVRLPFVNRSNRYRLSVKAFNQSTFERARERLVTLPSIAPPQEERDDAGTRTGIYQIPFPPPSALVDFDATSATWRTECFATQLEEVQSLAVCDPLAAEGPTTVTLATSEFALADGGVVRCDTGPADAGTDAGDAGDAGAGGPSFTTVRARTRTSSAGGGQDAGPERDVRCPTPYAETFAPEPQSVSIDAVLLGAGGAEVGRTSCTAETRPGTTVPAKCDPVR
jgi:hypothetical protein